MKKRKEKRSCNSFYFLCLKSNRKHQFCYTRTFSKYIVCTREGLRNKKVFIEIKCGWVHVPHTAFRWYSGEPLHNRWHWTKLQSSLPGILGNCEDNSVIKQDSSHPEVYRPTLLQFVLFKKNEVKVTSKIALWEYTLIMWANATITNFLKAYDFRNWL